MILGLGAQVEEALVRAVQAIEERDPELALDVIKGDKAIDQIEIEIEEECLATLAMDQPVAFDLRFVIASLKINHELERIADHAASIAQQAQAMASQPDVGYRRFELHELASRARTMLRSSLDALVSLDPDIARAVIRSDDEVDRIHHQMYGRIEAAISERPDRARTYLHLLSLSRGYERIGDHTVNIAQDVLYMIDGEILSTPRQALNTE